jgi:hypothetical protein
MALPNPDSQPLSKNNQLSINHMKRKIASTLLVLGAGASPAVADQGLYYTGSEAQEPLPLEWVVGANLTWDDNPTPTAVGPGANDEVMSINPYVGVSFVNMTPQDTLDVFARVGAIYYFDEPAAAGSDDLYPQVRAGLNWTRRINERLRFSSRNLVSYELEPDLAYGFATTRQIDAYLYWKTDNSIGYRWTERFATYTGLKLTGLDYDDSVRNNDRFTWQFYNQFRYQLTPQTVLTGDYRYAQTEGDGLAADSTSHYLLGGVEHRFSPNTILIARAGAQIRESDAVRGNDTTSPFVELALRSQINQQFSVRAFARYANEVYDTTRRIGFGIYDFDDRQTLRIGVSSEYAVSQKVTVFGGIDYIPASFDDGRLVGGFGAPSSGGIDEDLVNAYIGVSVQFAENLYGSLSYNYTDSDSDFAGYTYDRNRINLGVRAEF